MIYFVLFPIVMRIGFCFKRDSPPVRELMLALTAVELLSLFRSLKKDIFHIWNLDSFSKLIYMLLLHGYKWMILESYCLDRCFRGFQRKGHF